MSTVQAHPEDGELLRYLDGELPEREARRVREHMKACWECRAAAEELEGAIADCVQYRKQVLQTYLPAPPAPWADLSQGFARIDSEVGAGSWMARLGRRFAAQPTRRWALPAAAAVVLAAGLFYQFRETPSVQAAALLKRAVAVAESRPAPARPIRMRSSVKNRAAIPTMFREARYNAENPLSAKAYQEWRDALIRKRDEVTTVPDPQSPGQNRYQIQTVAGDGDLALARLTLRATDLRPVEGRFEFRNSEWVEYEEIPDAFTTDGGNPAGPRVEDPMRQAVPSRQAALPSGSSASISEELRVLAALHGIGADLGDPVEVSVGDGRVIVSGIGINAQRQQEIRRALEDIPNVSVQFTDPAASGAAADSAADVDASGKATAAQSRLEQQLGGRAEFERFSGQLLDQMDSAMARVYALRSLAQRFPATAAMTPADTARLRDLAREHIRTLSLQVHDLHRTLAPVLVSLGGKTAQGRPATARTWQTASEEVYRLSRRLEVLLSALMGVTPDPVSGHIPSEVLSGFADLTVEVDALEQMM
jgi:anti-sigma factor RsiW